MAYEEIQYEVADRLATVTLNRPAKLNAWTLKMQQELRDAMFQAEKDENVRVIILTGAGRAFCAGVDMQNLGFLAGGKSSAKEIEEMMAKWLEAPKREGVRSDLQRTYSYLLSIGKPIIAAVNGHVAGLGLVVALYCDLRMASDQAKFTTAFSRRGLIAEHGLSWLLPRVVGLANGLDLLFSARTVDAAEALRMGLVSRVMPQEKFMASVREYALELATMVSPRALRVMKQQVYEGLLQSLSQATDIAVKEMFASFGTEDFREGVAHFLEKRPPQFTGR